jgi:5-methylcytosine-specific restriction endonuclease McrA
VFKSKSGARKTVLQNAVNSVKTRKALYLSNRSCLHNLRRTTYSGVQSAALEHCYDSSTNALAEIKVSLIKNIKTQNEYLLSKCPYCLVREPSTWDHYLPKAKYPEYSVFSPNLIRVCDVCNRKKSDGLVQNTKEAIHTYFDKLPNTELLVCDVTLDNANIPIMNFNVPNPTNNTQITLVQNHFNAFDLAETYIDYAKDYLSVLLQEFANKFPTGITAQIYKQELIFIHNQIPMNRGYNYWQAALLKGLARNLNLVSVINNLQCVHSNNWKRV